MDLFLLDLILKGRIPENARILDAGCGEGRNAIYFIQEGFDYLGIDSDESKIQLAQYMSNNISTSKARFEVGDISELKNYNSFDLVICSRVLHFADSEEEFYTMWENLVDKTAQGGLIYVSIDSTVDNDLGRGMEDKYEFPDGAIRFALTGTIYDEIRKGFEIVEPLKTLIHSGTRAQSYFTFRKT